MTGGILQLSAYGVENMFITDNPQITFFKSIYRRHTNFSIEVIPQLFTHTPDFGKKVTCILSRSGDLLSKIYLVVNLPILHSFLNNDGSTDTLTKIAWVKKIGFALLKSVEIEIGGLSIDKQYGEWLHIWHELNGPMNINYLKMIGLTHILNEYTSSKNTFLLYIPLQFWFCKYRSLAIPILNLQYHEVKLNIEFNSLDKCINTTPTHYIKINQDIINFTKNEYIEQNIDGEIAFGIFRHYDVLTKYLYYHKLSRNAFISITNTTVTNEVSLNEILNNPNNQKYLIKGLQSKFTVMPFINTNETVYAYNKQRNISINDSFLLVDYIYLDDEERVKFSQAKHEYLIEQINISTEQIINTTNRRINLEINNPVKLLVFVAQQAYMQDTRVNDWFNYTDDYKYIYNKNILNDKQYSNVGSNLIDKATVLLNGHERISYRNIQYYNWLQYYQHFNTYSPDEGINMYAFCLFPDSYQPSGACNMSKIDYVAIQLKLKSIINFNNNAKFKIYYVTYNVLRIMNGLSHLLFTL